MRTAVPEQPEAIMAGNSFSARDRLTIDGRMCEVFRLDPFDRRLRNLLRSHSQPRGNPQVRWCEMPNVAINGLGRIGRAALKILLDADGLDLVAVNDIADLDNLAYLLRYDTVYGRYHRAVDTPDGALLVGGRRIAAFAERDPANLPWADLGVDLVLDCTGVFKSEDGLRQHIQAGASFVILSAPTTSETVPTVAHAVTELAGRFDGNAVRATIPVGSIADIVFVVDRPTTAQEVNDAFQQEAASAQYQGILGVSEDPLVSADIVGDPRAAIVDLDLTRVVDDTLVKVMAWYHNEWGFTHQMIREARSTLGVAETTAEPGR
jgi:glyceraldehyde-3-phosphate dehydrogenase/erythrose-4-phosphate dehydrogenase